MNLDELDDMLHDAKVGSGVDMKSTPPTESNMINEPFEMSFGVTIRFYPGGKAWVQSTWPLGKARFMKNKKKKIIKKMDEVKIEDVEEY